MGTSIGAAAAQSPAPSPADRPLQLVRRIPKESLIRVGENRPHIKGISYNSTRDELFFVDSNYSRVVRSLSLRDNAGDNNLRNVYSLTDHMRSLLFTVCYVRDSDAVLVCSREFGTDGMDANWLVVLNRSGSEWREAQRLQTDLEGRTCCALSDSRVLVGEWYSTKLELYCLKRLRGPHIALEYRIRAAETYSSFSATISGSRILVAMSFADKSVRVHLLRRNQLTEIARIRMRQPNALLLWLADRLLATEWYNRTSSDAVIELEVNGTDISRRRELIASGGYLGIKVGSWCAVEAGLAISHHSNIHELLHYSFI